MSKLQNVIKNNDCKNTPSCCQVFPPIRGNISIDLPALHKHNAAITGALHYHFLFISLILIFTLSAIAVSIFFPSSTNLSFSLYNKIMGLSALLFVALFFLWRVLVMMIYDKPKHPTLYLLHDIRNNYLTCHKLAVLAIFLFFFPLFSSSFTYLKSMIPLLNAFSWDPFLAELDRLLHFGNDPWRLLQPFLGYPIITMTINVLYNLWIFFWFFYFFYMFFSLDKMYLRMQFLLSFILCWGIIGVILATIFSSAGPCYFSRLYANDPYFCDLMAYLNMANSDHNIWALSVQDVLWQRYAEIELGIGSGISAMPSMHVSITFLITLTHFQINRKIGIILFIYTLIIFLGSIHLGWHYAVDGYISIIATYVIWRTVGYILKNLPKTYKYKTPVPVK